MKIVLLFGGRGAEHEVSVLSAKHIFARLTAHRHTVVAIGMNHGGAFYHFHGAPARFDDGAAISPVSLLWEGTHLSFLDRETGDDIAFDLIFSTIHGKDGEDGTLQGVFTLARAPFVGAGVASSAVGMNKRLAKTVLQSAGVPVVPYLTARGYSDELAARVDHRLKYPLFVKPNAGGSSIGVSRVANERELASAVALALREDEEILIEEAVDGTEIEVAVLERDGTLLISPPGEIIPAGEFYDYAAKYHTQSTRFALPAPLSLWETAYAKQIAATAFRTIGCRDMARVDLLRRKDGALFFNEINTLPGFTEDSLFPRLFALIGIDPLVFLTEGRA